MTESEAQKWLEKFEWDDREEISEALGTICEALQEYPKFRAIGTLEEFKALKYKNEPKKVVVEHVPKTSWTREVSHYLCPCCNHIFSFGGTTYCSTCGQKIDWKGGVTDERTGSD